MTKKVTGLLGTKKISVLGSSLSLGASYIAKCAMPGESLLEKPLNITARQDVSSVRCEGPCMSFTID